MTDKEINQAIAEYCGWTEIEPCKCANGQPRGYSFAGAPYKTHIPSYAQDLNAMHEAEKFLDSTNGGIADPDCLRYAYGREVYRIVPASAQPFRASARQRAEAFLRAVGKWEEAKP